MNDPKDHTALYVAATVAVCIVAMLSIVIIFLIRPDRDNTSLIAIVVGLLIPVVSTLLAASVQQLHSAVNGRLTQLLELTRTASRAEGKLEGRDLP